MTPRLRRPAARVAASATALPVVRGVVAGSAIALLGLGVLNLAALSDEAARDLVNGVVLIVGGCLLAVWTVVLRIIPARRSAERRVAADLAQRAARLERSHEDLSQLTAVAVHDLSEPLRIVVGYSELLMERAGDGLDDEARSYMAAIGRAVDRMQQLFDSLLRYSRVDDPTAQLEPVSCDEVLDEALRALGERIAQTNAVITRSELPTIDGIRWQLVQLFQNLVGNAIKFSDGRRPEVHVSAQQEDAGWQISVRDNGIGVPAGDERRIFDMFERLDRRQYPGTGLGLAIVKRIVERHGGHVWMSPAPGGGAIFSVTLPTVRRRRTDVTAAVDREPALSGRG